MFLGHKMSPEGVKHELTPVLGSDLLVPTRETFVAYGGDLPFDVVFVVGFDGVQSRVLSVRYLVRPDEKTQSGHLGFGRSRSKA